MSSDKVLALVRYYAREGYARQLQTVCSEVLRKRPNDPLLAFWRAVGMIMEGSSSEALRELQAVSRVPELELAATAAMVAAHEAAKVVNQDEVINLNTRLELEERAAGDTAALHLASFYSITSQHERARDLVTRILMNQPDHLQAAVQLGWIILSQYAEEVSAAGSTGVAVVDDSELDEAETHFAAALAADPQDLEALMGRVRLGQRRHDMPAALELLTEVCVRFTWFMPAAVEKAGVLLAQGDWDQMSETLTRILSVDPQNIMGLAWQALYQLVREGDNKGAVKVLQDLFAAISKGEPRHAGLFYTMARCFGRLAGTDSAILAVTYMMAERASTLKPDHAPYMVELGYQKLFQGDYATAAERFAAAQACDELSLDASCGALEAAILQNDIQDADSSLNFLEEMHNSQASLSLNSEQPSRPPTLEYLQGLLAWKQNHIQEAMLSLEAAILNHIGAASKVPPSLDMYTTLWPSRAFSTVRMLLASVGSEPRAPTEAPSPVITKCSKILQLLTKQVPALIDGRELSARALFLIGSLDEALRKAQDILRSHPDNVNLHLLVCSSYMYQDKPQLAQAALEQAVSANFAVRETAQYHIISSKVLLSQAKLEEARKVLEAGMSLPGVRNALTPAQRARLSSKGIAEPSLHERASIYLLLAQTFSRLSKLPDVPEAKKYIEDAIREFKDTSEEVRVTVADSEMAIARGDVDAALKKLRKIPSESPHYVKARMAMADIYLKHRNDKAGYIKCYMDLVEKDSNYDSHCMLGEAFMQIQEHEKAVHAFEKALEFEPRDGELVTKIARALVTTHEYQGAIDAYRQAASLCRGNYWLLLEQAGLLVRLRQWGQALDVLNRVLQRPEAAASGVDGRSIDVQVWEHMAKLYRGNSDVDNYLESLNRALELQKQVISMLRGELPETVQSAKDKAAGLCFEVAEYHRMQRKTDKAKELYQEALKACDTHAPSLVALARLQLADGNVDECQAQCVVLLKINPEDEEAAIMLAELMLHKEHYDSAIYHFDQLMERRPCHWKALSQLISLLRRVGKLDEANKYFTKAEAASPKCISDPGYQFCKGLHARYLGEPRDAVRQLNLARSDAKWGSEAIMHMVEIYLNPDNDAIWEERDVADAVDAMEAVDTARSLLSQVRPQDKSSLRYQVLDCYARMLTREPGQVEAALGTLLDLGNQDPNNVPVLLAMATGFMLLKQTPKARNQLKRVQKIPYKSDEGDEFERSWLLLADIHIQGGKFDLAQDLCQKCLKYNKSCAKAWEYLGAIMEREQSYKDASDHYEKAWKHSACSSAAVGYKLAFNYLKAKRFVEAIDVCHKVIKTFPDYPKIRADILDKARQNLKQ